MSKQKLLLADDSITIQKVVNLTFADEGIEVVCVGDGNSAMEKFVESIPDLVMVDVNMPGLDGYRICEMIKQDDETKHVPVILLVGSFEPFDEDEARRVGANDYLTKPFQSIRQLVNKVTVLLSKSANGDGNGSKVEPARVVEVAKPQETVKDEVSIFPQTEPEFTLPESKIEPEFVVEESSPEPFGDAGMDDEMIQASQIINDPINEIRQFETPILEVDSSGHDEIIPADEIMVEEFSDEIDVAKTQPFTPEEAQEISDSIPETVEFSTAEKIYPDEVESADNRTESLEQQMVSEFEVEATEIASDFGSEIDETAEPVYAPYVEIEPDEVPVSFDDIPEPIAEKGFEITEIAEKIDSIDTQSTEALKGSWDIYESEQTADEIEVEKSTEVSENVSRLAEFEERNESEATFESDEDIEYPSSIVEPERHFEFQDAVDKEDEVEEPRSFEAVESETIEEVSSKSDLVDSEGVLSNFTETKTAEFRDTDQGNSNVNAFERSSGTEPIGEEQNDPEPPQAPIQNEAVVEDVSPIQEIPVSEFQAAEATTEPPVSAMISKKDTNDSVESVIVSEFARHSISLSSEAVETIAARIAEKISEKIVQQLATDVVTDLADLIVDRMEQRKLK